MDFELRRGEIHAVLGENGAGKSTLMHIVRGLIQPDSGEISVNGNQVDIRNPKIAGLLGIGMVFQHFMLVPAFTVLENLALSLNKTSPPLSIPGLFTEKYKRALAGRIHTISSRLGWNIPLDIPVAELSVGAQQRVEIVKALLGEARILLFDEPTAVLTPGETEDLFRVLRTLREDGFSIVFVSHKLSEIMGVCDRVTVLRRGVVTGCVNIDQTNMDDLAFRMIGNAFTPLQNSNKSVPLELSPRLKLTDVSTHSERHSIALADINFTVHKGEILGVAGVDGNGQVELAQILIGERKISFGSIHMDGESIQNLDISKLNRLGISYIPSDRHAEGLALSLSIKDNLLLQNYAKREYRIGPFLKHSALRFTAHQLAVNYDIRTSSLEAPASSLSGGNQQKIVAARALSSNPKCIIALYPTRGLDVAASAYLHECLLKCRDAGAAVVLISNELDELIALSNRIAVMSKGRISGIVDADTPLKEIGLLMGGEKVASP